MGDLVQVMGRSSVVKIVGKVKLPAAVIASGERFAYWYETYLTGINNPNTKAAYINAIERFMRYLNDQNIPAIKLDPRTANEYFTSLKYAVPTIQQHVAAVRKLYDGLVIAHLVPFNPLASYKAPKQKKKKAGKTPVLSGKDMKLLLDSIATETVIGKRDKAIIGLMVYSFARVGAVVGMLVKDYYYNGRIRNIILHEKNETTLDLPVHHKAQDFIDAYIEAAEIADEKKGPLFRSWDNGNRRLTLNPMHRNNVYAMVKKRSMAIGFDSVCNHTFRATGITVYMQKGGTLEKAQHIAGHADSRTTKLYDRSDDIPDREELERIILE